jgi:hypothetical protein
VLGRAPAPEDRAPGRGQALLRALLRDAREQSTNLRLTVPTVAAQSPDGRQLPSLCPPCHRFRINSEHCCDLGRRKQRLGLWGTCRHYDGLSSWTLSCDPASDVFMAPFRACLGCPIWSYCYHIAITSGDIATTRSRSFGTCPPDPRLSASRCVILQTRTVATGGLGKVMSASCRLLGVAIPAVASSVKLDPRGLFLPGPCVADLCGLLDRGFTSKYAGEHAPSRRQRMLRPARAVSLTPLPAEEPAGRNNYRQCRDNPPQFYGMLCHEVFAPHGQLHALRDINTPCAPRGIRWG